jgi:hypothetical protein
MKKLSFLFITLLLTITMYAADPIKLNLVQGKSYKIRVNSHQNVERTVNDQKINVEVITNNVFTFKALGQENDIFRIEVKLDSMENKISSPGGKMEISFNKPAKSGDYIGMIRNRLCQFTIIAKISSAGKFIGFTNYKTFKDSVLSVMDIVPDSKKDQVQQQTDGLIKESVIRSMVEPFFNYIPEKSVNPGDKWEISFIQPSNFFNLLMSNTFVLDKIENGQAKITGNTEIEALPSNEPDKPGTPQRSVEAKGTATVDLLVDTAIGFMSKSSNKSHLEGVITIQNQGKETKTALVVDSKSEITRVD